MRYVVPLGVASSHVKPIQTPALPSMASGAFVFVEHVAAHSSAVDRRGITTYCLFLVLPPEPARSSVLQSIMYVDIPTVRSVLSASGQMNWSALDPRRTEADVLSDADADTDAPESAASSEDLLSLLSEAPADEVSSMGIERSSAASFDSSLDVDAASVSSVGSVISDARVEGSSSLGTRVAVGTVSSMDVGNSTSRVAGSGIGIEDASTSFSASVSSGLGIKVASRTVVSSAASVGAEGSFPPPMEISADGVSSIGDGSGIAGTDVSGLGIEGMTVSSVGSWGAQPIGSLFNPMVWFVASC